MNHNPSVGGGDKEQGIYTGYRYQLEDKTKIKIN